MRAAQQAPSQLTASAVVDASRKATAALRQPTAAATEAAKTQARALHGLAAPAGASTLQLAAQASAAALRHYHLAKAVQSAEVAEAGAAAAGTAVALAGGPAAASTTAAVDDMEPEPPKRPRHGDESSADVAAAHDVPAAPHVPTFTARSEAIAAKAAAGRHAAHIAKTQAMLS